MSLQNVCVLEQTTRERNWSADDCTSTSLISRQSRNRKSVIMNDDAIATLDVIMSYVCLALGGPGNTLSAIIWLRRHVISKNSSALYLSVLAINDLLYLISYPVSTVPSVVDPNSWLDYCIYTVRLTTEIIEPLLVLSFSVERLIAISRPLQV